MRSGLDDQGRQAGQIGEYRADEADSGVGRMGNAQPRRRAGEQTPLDSGD